MAEAGAQVVVVGGGISGLVAAHTLSRAGCRVTVLEATDRLGGKIRTAELAGVPVEDGPDAFLPRDEGPLELCRAVGLGDDLVEPEVFGAYLWSRGALRKLPAGFPYGFPRSPYAAWRAGLLSARGAARAVSERFVSGPLEGPDVSIAAFATNRFGAEVLDHLVDPMLAGTRAGAPGDISLAAGAREIDGLARSHRSLLGVLRTLPMPEPRFRAVAGGMQRLVTHLERALPAATCRTNARVERIERSGEHAYRVVTQDGALDALGIVVAAPAFGAADVLRAVNEPAARKLAAISYASSATISLVYPDDACELPPGGSGFLVASADTTTISGCTWYSRKWPASTPPGSLLVRCFVGRAGRHPTLDLDDDELARAVHDDLVTKMRVEGDPVAGRVARWERGLPQYRVGHLDLVDAIESDLAATPGLALAGAGYRGSGIPDCIVQAERAAGEVLRSIDPSRR